MLWPKGVNNFWEFSNEQDKISKNPTVACKVSGEKNPRFGG
jgi:hypothetical protein